MARRRARRPQTALDPPIHLTKSGLARQHIQELILSGTARAGDRITSRAVCEAVDISETPVREAIRSLAAEGWLDFHPHHGVVVASIQAEHIAEIYALRGRLAALAVELGHGAYTEAQLAVLDRIMAESEQAVATGDTQGYARLNRDFHLLLCDTPHTQWTLKLLGTLWAQTSAARRGFEIIPNRIRASLAEHRAIREAVAQGETAHAAALLVAHERIAGEALIASLGAERGAG